MTVAFVCVTAIILLIFGVPSYTDKDNLSAVVLLLFLFCSASASVVYCVEKVFREPSLGQMTMLVGNILVGILTILTISLLEGLYMMKVGQQPIVL